MGWRLYGEIRPNQITRPIPRQLIFSNTPGERLADFPRAIQVENRVFVPGATASDAAGATLGQAGASS
jgi:hypothetical protein